MTKTTLPRPLKSLIMLPVFCLSLLNAEAAEIKTQAKHAIMVEGSTGAVLFEHDADVTMPPSSMSKLMTIYLTFERLRDGNILLDDELDVSENIWRKWRLQGSTMFLKAGQKVTVRDLLMGVIVQSGNDACAVLAEGLAGSETVFVEWSNEKAQELGMTNSHFTNVNGWPDPQHYMSARDLATLSQHLVSEFPDYYAMFKEKKFTYNDISQTNRNPILYSMPSADGLKTGHTEDGGYGVAASAIEDGRRLILVINGLKSNRARAREAERLLNYGFRNFSVYPLLKAGEVVDEANVWLGMNGKVPLVIEEDVVLSISRQDRRKMKAKIIYTGPIPAPIVKGQPIAMLEISAKDMKPVTYPLVAGADVSKLGGVSRLKAAFNYLLMGSAGSE
ncbi:D-alanyl-D-alanine carboxypeptidase family protein [Paremcibacter congregatus]|uniref:serine-type D-Ala-D-Ala carboxypeptidase n=1 Tax=Paremcibacter congregatus TaxID=2043170 RepID=A0A2G4YVE5_9PROT|nr:D-alanyl-D-alanine carboxypeptidase family protein [Paremcibacter congregatus]PHZ86285.1 D-alanyl-D-alanine carboxypeptidase [Paremcibacter congregatus]QDE27252.1 D-alanyl-D-alanine carboxypeptidase [Paremcibacter congregatus]